MGSASVSPPVVQAKALVCPNCGGAVELRGFAHTLTVVCPQCLTVLDASTPLLTILSKFQGQTRIQPGIPLGTRGNFGNTVFEVIGFQLREMRSEDGRYSWAEYLLFNPYQGFRYLSEYQGHWNFIRVMSALPRYAAGGRVVWMDGRAHKRFSQYSAVTAYVLGEFPWQARVGDRATVNDYISPPFMLSSEQMGSEETWSLGEYRTGQQIWQALKLPGTPPPAQGVYANQPSPLAGKVGSAWRTWLWLMLAMLAIVSFFAISAGRHEVFRQRYSFSPGTASEAAFVTSPFELQGRPANLEVAIRTDLRSDWAYFNFALVNESTEKARDFGKEISFYGDEGSPRDRVVLPNVAAGRYYLRVEPEKAANSGTVNYELVVRRDVPTFGWFWICAVLLTVPPFIKTMRRGTFETTRWRESDYGSAISGKSGASGE